MTSVGGPDARPQPGRPRRSPRTPYRRAGGAGAWRGRAAVRPAGPGRRGTRPAAGQPGIRGVGAQALHPVRGPALRPRAALGGAAGRARLHRRRSRLHAGQQPDRSADADAAPSCLLKLTTGFTCPGCGGTRAAWYLLHGDLGAAARHHLLFVFAVPFLIYMYVAWAGRAVVRLAAAAAAVVAEGARALPGRLGRLHGGAQPAVGTVHAAPGVAKHSRRGGWFGRRGSSPLQSQECRTWCSRRSS